MSVTDITTITG